MKHLLLRFSAVCACSVLSLNMTAQSQCNNMDFEDSTFVGWTGATGSNTGILVPVNWTPGYVSNGNNAAVSDAAARQTIITTNFLDQYAIDPATMLPDTQMTSLAPGGGIASVRLGNSNVGYECEKVSYQYPVVANNAWFQFQFASVMQDPGHPWSDQPYFMVNFYDQNGNPIVAANDTIWAGDTSVPYIAAGNDPSMLYRRWTPLSRDLSAYVGTTVTVEFVNSDCVYGGHFGYTYIDVSCMGTAIPNVWPGDCDYDLQANNVDLLTLGVTYGATGTTRASATTTWQAEPSADWAQSVPLGANYKHSDTNGDGTIDLDDTLAINLNYAQTHTFRLQPGEEVQSAPVLYLQPQVDTVGASSYAYVDVYIASASMPVSDLYGIAFTITYDNGLVQSGSTQTSFGGSVLGVKNTTMITLAHDDFSSGSNDVSMVRMNHTELNGYGYLGTMRITTAGVTQVSTLNLGVSNIHAINAQMVNIPVQGMGTTVVIDPAAGVADPAPVTHIGLYPNPANESVVVSSEASETIEITNALGQVVSTTTATGTSTTIDISGLAAGVYFVNVYGVNGKATEQLIVE